MLLCCLLSVTHFFMRCNRSVRNCVVSGIPAEGEKLDSCVIWAIGISVLAVNRIITKSCISCQIQLLRSFTFITLNPTFRISVWLFNPICISFMLYCLFVLLILHHYIKLIFIISCNSEYMTYFILLKTDAEILLFWFLSRQSFLLVISDT